MSLGDLAGGYRKGWRTAVPEKGRFEHRLHFWQDARERDMADAMRRPETAPDPYWKEGGVPGAIGYGAGRLAGDIAGEKTRGFWWRYNHPLGITYSIGENIAKKSGFTHEAAGGPRVNAGPAAAMGFGLATAMNVASGNFDMGNLDALGRPRGYSAVFADPEDPTKSKMPVVEPLAGWILGSRHKLLPYERFTQERPDVSPEQYLKYQRYQSWGHPEFLGLEKADPIFTGGAGAITGLAMTKNKRSVGALGKNLAIGSVLGAVTPGITKGVSGLGVIKGTWSNLDNEPEVQLLGYKVPLSAIAATTVAGTGMYLMGKRINRKPPAEFEQLELNLNQK
jgi:hypothetical protein